MPSTATQVRASLGSSGSVATPGSSGTSRTRSSTRRSTGPSTWRSARASPRSAARTKASSTGTWSRTCVRAGSSCATATSSRRTGAGCSEQVHALGEQAGEDRLGREDQDDGSDDLLALLALVWARLVLHLGFLVDSLLGRIAALLVDVVLAAVLPPVGLAHLAPFNG